MFKKRCERCDRKIDRKFDFCPYCGIQTKNEDYGLLGKSDNIGELDNFFNQPGFNLGNKGSFMEKILGNAFKMLEKEIRAIDQQEENIEKRMPDPRMRTDFQLFINGQKVNLPQFQQHLGQANQNLSNQFQRNNNQNQVKQKRTKLPEISKEILEKSKKLPRKEAKAKLTRLKEKIIYELDTPGLDSIDNVLVNKLEGAIEIRAYTDKAVFYKTLPIKLALAKYAISPEEGKLFLEFGA